VVAYITAELQDDHPSDERGGHRSLMPPDLSPALFTPGALYLLFLMFSHHAFDFSMSHACRFVRLHTYCVGGRSVINSQIIQSSTLNVNTIVVRADL